MDKSSGNILTDAANSFAFLSKMAIDMMIKEGEISKSQELEANLAAAKILSKNPRIAMDMMSKDKNIQLSAITQFFDEIKGEMGIKTNVIKKFSKISI